MDTFEREISKREKRDWRLILDSVIDEYFDFDSACPQLAVAVASDEPWRYYEDIRHFSEALKIYKPTTRKHKDFMKKGYSLSDMKKLVKEYPGYFTGSDKDGTILGISRNLNEAIEIGHATGEPMPVIFRLPIEMCTNYFAA